MLPGNVRNQDKLRDKNSCLGSEEGTIDANNTKHKDCNVSTAASILPEIWTDRNGIKIEVDIQLRDTLKPGTPNTERENIPEKEKMLSEDEVVQLTNSSVESTKQNTCTGKEGDGKSCRRSLNFSLIGEDPREPMLDEEYENSVDFNIDAKSSVVQSNGRDGEMDEKQCGINQIRPFPVLLHVYHRKRKGKSQVSIKSKSMDHKSSICSSTSGAVMCREGKKECNSKEMIKPINVKSKRPSHGNTSRKSKMNKKNGKITDIEHEMLVPCEERLCLSTKVRSTARVELDKRTMREWKVLVENLDSECTEEAKWWEQERLLFHERVKLFISHVRCIQGDRKFSQWRGSVIDSIVGAFLTQNASDNASSSAFMSLAAKYPYRAIGENSSPEASIGFSTVQLRGTKRSRSSNSQHRKDTTRAKERKSEETKHRRKGAKKENVIVNWDNLKKLYSKSDRRKKSDDTSEAVDWDAVRNAPVEEISKTIERRGMNNNLATRIKNFLDILSKQLGSTDLEWLRNVPHQKAKEYLLSIPGMGLKSVECVRLLALIQPAFPIDTNAGRIAVRLGWVPLQPLTQGHQFHRLKQYPKIDTVQKYLWPRLSKLDPSTLYELHCQMITFGKVFCTKRNPNCNSCPLQEECKHFKSSSASTQLSLPGIHERSKMESKISLPLAVHLPALSGTSTVPLQEVVGSRSLEFKDQDIENFGFNRLPRIRLNNCKLKESLDKFSYEYNIPLQDGKMVNPLMAIKPETTTTPLPKLRNMKCIRTDHQVYVLPDSHTLLAKLPKREPNDTCPYLLAIWTQENFNEDESLSFHDMPGEDSVYGTFLVPSRTAMRGCFPLNGTYFQANEVFADDESSDVPIIVSWTSIRDLPKTTLHCGTTISAIFRGMKSEEVRWCFLKGFVCLRGFDRKTREPKPLPSRFHLPNVKEG
ncbi:unnamed protein product [Fraxinus pennsylvanica]|uniref:Demeter RRM-fold domain-containing protein n=1 Tax=Fraxinus pennsylvanica TaxID=56036 RepID=A0AAD1ZQU2_9LAMI|nr:unnamed protein product [Fraxinus pennsylvanica]